MPSGIAIDAAGSVYVADTNNQTLRRIDVSRIVTTIAGVAGQRGSEDGTGPSARFSNPASLAVDSAANLYVLDGGKVRRVTPAGVVTTLAGSGTEGAADGVGGAASFRFPGDIAVDGAGNVYVADTGNFTIRKVAPDGTVTTIAGAAGQSGTADGLGPAARFASPLGIAADSAGNLFVADSASNTIRKITPGGDVTTLAGKPGAAGNDDGTLAEATFREPLDVGLDGAGNLYVLERSMSNSPQTHVRRVAANGTVGTIPGEVGLYVPAIAVGGDGGLLASDAFRNRIVRVEASGQLTPLAGSDYAFGTADAVGPAARFGSGPLDIAAAPDASLYVGDLRLRRITADGRVTTVADESGTVAADSAGNVYMGQAQCTPPHGGALPSCQGRIRKLAVAGSVVDVTPLVSSDGSGLEIHNPTGLAVDASDNLYVADNNASMIRRITPSGDITALARDVVPNRIAVDRAGNAYFAQGWALYKLTPGGVPGVLAGSPDSPGTADGAGPAARFREIAGMAVDEAGNVYVGDPGAHTVRKVSPTGFVTTVVGSPGLQGFTPGPLPGVIDGPDDVAVAGTDLYISMPGGVAVVHNRP